MEHCLLLSLVPACFLLPLLSNMSVLVPSLQPRVLDPEVWFCHLQCTQVCDSQIYFSSERDTLNAINQLKQISLNSSFTKLCWLNHILCQTISFHLLHNNHKTMKLYSVCSGSYICLTGRHMTVDSPLIRMIVSEDTEPQITGVTQAESPNTNMQCKFVNHVILASPK